MGLDQSYELLRRWALPAVLAAAAILIALAGSWATAIFSFEMVFVPKLIPPLVVIAIITSITMLLGLLNSRGIVNNPPLEVLRKEI